MIGICGTRGIGKSTVTRAVCNFLARYFEDFWFLSNVIYLSEHYKAKSLYDIVRGTSFTSHDFHNLITQLEFQQKKILVIVDDVELDQLRALVARHNLFGYGSRIIITSRNRQMLASHGIESIYEVKKLRDDEALQLLSWTAFKNDKVNCDYEEVSKRAILCSDGLPLALEELALTYAVKP